ncbi:MAG: hypothetical protein GF392_03715 [Candidatus Omnitrophica bacterium]|nr:hypothetical protein [Candidatus Omnitrophota bacterium]
MKNIHGTSIVMACLLLTLHAGSPFAFCEEPSEQPERGAVSRWWDNLRSTLTPEKVEDPGAGRMSAPEITESARSGASAEKTELINSIAVKLDAKPRVISELPGLSRKTGLDGTEQYYYRETGGVPLRLRLLDRPVLEELLIKVEAVSRELPVPTPPGEAIDYGSLADEAGLSEQETPRSRKEMIEIIERRLDSFDEILYRIPGLTVKKSASGRTHLYYAPEGQVAMKIAELDDKTLHDLFVRVNSEATRLNTERILKQVRQAEQLRRITAPRTPPQPPRLPDTGAPSMPPQPPSTPRVNVPKQPPRVNTGGRR